jgi:hypothetical protein
MAMVSQEQIRSILNLAVRAPSGDNVQPWRFEWDGEALTVIFRPSLAHHVLDAGHSASGIALGCLLQSIEIAAATEGFSIQTGFKGFHKNESACAEIRFVAGYRSNESWIDALSKRATDRRPFRGGRLPMEALQKTAAGFDQQHRAKVYPQHSVSNELLECLVSAETLTVVHPRIFPDTLPWIRMSRREVERKRDGMPWQGTGIGILEYPVIRFMRRFPGSFRFLSRAGMRRIYAQRMKQLIKSSAGLLCFSAPDPGPDAPIQVGRLAMRLWLRLTELGYGVQPLTIASLFVYNARIGALDPESRRLFERCAPRAEEILHRAFGIPEGETPVWMFRTGLSGPLPRSWVTPRKELPRVLIDSIDRSSSFSG